MKIERKVDSMLSALRADRARLDIVITDIERILATETIKALPPAPGKKRGRKSMSDAERGEVSRRMTAYWAAYRRTQERKKSVAAK